MRSTSFRVLLTVAALALWVAPGTLTAAPGGGGGGGGGAGGGSYVRPARSPEQKAEREYKRGLRRRDAAWKHERKAIKASSGKRHDKESSRAAKDWTKAAKHYRAAITNLPKYYQAHTSLGYALRKLGQYDSSIAAYDRALELEPDFSEALEYRAEAYLELARLRDVSHSYMRLLQIDREKAGLLMVAMEAWLEKHANATIRAAPVSPQTVERFRSWIKKHKENEARGDEPSNISTRW